MAIKIRKKTNVKQQTRYKRKAKIRNDLAGTTERPRLAVFRSNTNIYVQIIDDVKGNTIVSASTRDDEIKGKGADTIEGAKQLGLLVAKKALAKKLSAVVFDRSGYIYHGRIKALADAAREGGLKF
ncbi:MAG: 50S ribosomal protein L18 [Xanthomonadaceae bacterium]|nr:50S ribosomal protein L18 [Xanthomonadaceae bacterium]